MAPLASGHAPGFHWVAAVGRSAFFVALGHGGPRAAAGAAGNGTVVCGATGCEVTSCTGDYADCNGTGTDGCEAQLTSATDCGLCDRDCGGQACTNKLCEPAQLGSAASAYRWARTSDALYRISGYTPSYGLAANYVLTRTPLGGGAEVVMHSDAKNPGGLVADDTYVYWAVNGTPAGVFRKAHTAPAATAPTPFFETASVPVQMSIQGGYMYWTNYAGAIYRRAMNALATDGGSEIVSAAQVAGSGAFLIHEHFVTTPTALYWVAAHTYPNSTANPAPIRTAPLTGGTATEIAGAFTSSFFKLSVVGEDLYWIRATNSAFDGVYHYAPGGAAESIVTQAGLNAVHATSDYLYLLGGSNTMYRTARSGGTALKLGVSDGLAYAMDFAGSSATSVYVLSSFTHGAGFMGDWKVLGYPL